MASWANTKGEREKETAIEGEHGRERERGKGRGRGTPKTTNVGPIRGCGEPWLENLHKQTRDRTYACRRKIASVVEHLLLLGAFPALSCACEVFRSSAPPVRSLGEFPPGSVFFWELLSHVFFKILLPSSFGPCLFSGRATRAVEFRLPRRCYLAPLVIFAFEQLLSPLPLSFSPFRIPF